MKLGTAAKRCKGRRAGAFRACVRNMMKHGTTRRRRRSRK